MERYIVLDSTGHRVGTPLINGKKPQHIKQYMVGKIGELNE